MATNAMHRAVEFRWIVVCVGSLLFSSITVGQDKKPVTIAGWGTVTDLAGDCTVKEQDGKLAVTVPGGVHDLNASAGGMKAPRVLKEIEGDFTVEVKVTGEFKPGEIEGSFRVRPFNGAGLLVWQDAGNYVRLERNVYWVKEHSEYVCYPPLLQRFKEGEEEEDICPAPTLYDNFFRARSTWLRLERRKDELTASYSRDGKEWTVAKTIAVELSKKLRAGIAVINTSAQPFTVEFENLNLSSASVDAKRDGHGAGPTGNAAPVPPKR